MPNRGTKVKGTWVENIIAKTYVEHPTWENKEIHKEVLKRVKREIQRRLNEKDPEPTPAERRKLNELLKRDWPGISVVEKLLPTYRPKYQKTTKSGGLDAPWSMIAFPWKEYPLPAEALPAVLQQWEWTVLEYKNPPEAFTNREAIWVARLYVLLGDSTQKAPNWKDMYPYDIGRFTSYYTQWERAYELTGQPFDTSKLDEALLNAWNPTWRGNVDDVLYDFPYPDLDQIIAERKSKARKAKKDSDSEGGTP